MSKPLKCSRCGKKAVTVSGVTQSDARHVFKCSSCGYRYTNGKTTADDVVTKETREARNR